VSRHSYLAAVAFVGCGFAAHAQTPVIQTVPAAPPSAAPVRPADEETPVAKPDVVLRADKLTEDRDLQEMVAEGNVEVRVEDRVLKADKLVYNRAKTSMHATGHVQITNADGSVQFADDIEADENFANGFATRFSLRVPGRAGVGDSTATASAAIRSQDGSVHTLEQAIYTNCPICREKGGTPTWSLRARKIEQDSNTKMVTYNDAVLEIKGVPVLYIPWFAHPDPTSERRSGLMIPDVGSSSKTGLNYEQPYYYVISPSEDITLRPEIFGKVNPLLKVDYRKRFFSGFVTANGSFTHEQEFDSKGDKFGEDTWRSHLYAAGAFAINEDWRWGFGIERQSDDQYDQRYDIDGEDDRRGLYSSQPRQLLSQLYSTGQTPDFYFETGALVFQGLRAGDDDARFPKVAPTLFTEKVYDFGNLGRISTDLSAVALMRDLPQTLPSGTPGNNVVLDTARVSAKADWKSQYVVGPGLVFSPFVEGRGDAYRIDNGTAPTRNVNRFLGLAGAQLSYPIIRRGNFVDLIIEPIVMAAYGTRNANNDGVPNEDSLLFESDDSNVFEPNSVTNYDLWEGGGRVALGMSATARFGEGYEVSGLVGRRWREEADPAFNAVSNLSGEKSDYVASVKGDLGSYFRTAARARLDDNLNLTRLDLDARTDFWRLHGDARYFKVTSNTVGVPDQEGIVLGGNVKVTKNWSALYYQTRNIVDKRDIRLALGVAYRDDCSYFAITYEHSGAIDRSLGQSDSIHFTFALTGLGSASDGRFD